MEHYDADMMCDDCGKVRCVCPPKEEKPDLRWMVTSQFKVVRVCDHIEAHTKKNYHYGLMERLNATHYKKRKDAEAAALALIMQKIDTAHLSLKLLNQVLEDKPWLK